MKQVNLITLTGVVSKLEVRKDKDYPACDHQYFTLNFDGSLCKDSINIVDWSSADIKDGDTVMVHGSLQSNQQNVQDGYTDVKEWFIIVYSGSTESYVIKVN